MKKIIALNLCIFTFLSFCGCAPLNGVVKNVKVKKVGSEIYSEEDINEAIEVIEKYFVKNFGGCRLEKIAYAGDETTKSEEQYRSEHSENDAEVIVLVSDFYVYPGGGDGSLAEDSTYTNWLWILERESNGNWEHKDHGY